MSEGAPGPDDEASSSSYEVPVNHTMIANLCEETESSDGVSAHSLPGSSITLESAGCNTPAGNKQERYANLYKKLHQGRRALFRIRCFVGGVMVTAGLASFVGHVACVVRFHFGGGSESLLGVLEQVAAGCLFAARDAALGLAPLPDDVRLTRAVISVQTLMSFLGAAFSFYMAWNFWHMEMLDDGGGPEGLRYRWVRVSFDLLMLWTEIPLSTMLFTAWRLPTAVKMQERMWKAIKLYTCLRISNYLWFLIYFRLVKGSFSAMVWQIPGLVLSLVVSVRLQVRQSIQGCLGSLLKEHGPMAAAASVAGLIGDCSTRDVLLQASMRFRVLPASAVKREDLASNVPDPTSFERTWSASLLECDAFISHSWRDCPDAKWAALQDWRAAFVERNGREPLIWLDKLCIDQTNIEADLRCLPIFLSGCKEMLVLCGPTYLSRLWCILEIFTFVHVVGEAEGMNLKLLVRIDHEEEDTTVIKRAFQEFDVEACQCSVQRDKETILSVIHAAFGDRDRFNAEVQSILDRQQPVAQDRPQRVRRLWTNVSETMSKHMSSSKSGSRLVASPATLCSDAVCEAV